MSTSTMTVEGLTALINKGRKAHRDREVRLAAIDAALVALSLEEGLDLVEALLDAGAEEALDAADWASEAAYAQGGTAAHVLFEAECAYARSASKGAEAALDAARAARKAAWALEDRAGVLLARADAAAAARAWARIKAARAARKAARALEDRS